MISKTPALERVTMYCRAYSFSKKEESWGNSDISTIDLKSK